MSKKELYVILGVSAIYMLRMSGVFMILPVLTAHMFLLQGVNGCLLGIAIGIYGFMQVIFQIPCGLISDKIGYKSVIIGGLVLFAIGSEIVAITQHIWGLIIGRALQGSGAISGSLIAFLLDSVKSQHHMRAVAFIGINFGITFFISIIFGPIITDRYGLYGLFHGITILAILAIILTYFIIPTLSNNFSKNNETFFIIFNKIKKIVSNIQLIRLSFNIFFIHIILILNFIVMPKVLINLGFSANVHWKVYSIIMLISSIVVLSYILYLEKKHCVTHILFKCMIILLMAELLMCMSAHFVFNFLFGMQLFFIVFSLIESILPAILHKISSHTYRSTTISIYSVGQFLGLGCGGILGGFLLELGGIWLVLCCAVVISTICVFLNK
ncbi:MFS transporter [Candidatus Blochmannia ocreatus (nom. nud.)]|uniref:MFS transporter n=1 Tax=Candidatus Blochmannia ocreatus (nom. nud.) TaxID=251538 RepID=A0ABY4STK8_9ENTR|nr:MFS transporter [Candidatus Blochmannia ocreatus]URJ25307.1 MFS transporter [Candidatus Blochmannia ocreatus]